eukprot:8634782-Pyramimonas_sp.AAC.1
MKAPEKNPGSLRGPEIFEYLTAIDELCASAELLFYTIPRLAQVFQESPWMQETTRMIFHVFAHQT